MPAKTTNILIFGATGLIGSHIVTSILASKSQFGKIGAFTSPNTVWTKSNEIDALKRQGVEIIAGDITSASDVHEAYNGYDTIVSTVGRPVIEQQLKLIQIADKHPDIKRFFPSEYGTDVEYSPASASEKPHQQKLKVRALLKTVQDLEYTYVVTGPYGDADRGLYLSASNPSQESFGTFDVARKRAVIFGTGNEKLSLTTMRDVGVFVVAALLHPSESTRNKALIVNSFTTTPKDIVAEFEAQTGGEKWRISYTSVEDLKAAEKEAWEKNLPHAGVLTLRRIWTEGGTLYEGRDNGVIGVGDEEVDSLESCVRCRGG